MESAADSISAVETFSNGDVLMGGLTTGSWASSNPDASTHLAAVKLNGDTGDELWRYQTDTSGSSASVSALVRDVAVDGDDNVFMVGKPMAAWWSLREIPMILTRLSRK